MKTIFSAIILLLVVPVAAEQGFVRLANALAHGTGPMRVEIGGKDIAPDGYRTGDVTGGIPLPPGTHQIKFTRDGVTSGTTRVVVGGSETTVVIPFAEEVPATPTKPAHWAVRVFRLKPQVAPAGSRALLVSVSKTPELRMEVREPDGKWNPTFVKRLATVAAPLAYPRGYVPLRAAGRDLQPIPVSGDGQQVVVLYDDEAGHLRSLHFHDQKFGAEE